MHQRHGTADPVSHSNVLPDLARLYMCYGDLHGVKDLLVRAKQLCEDGGDWERKNKLKVCAVWEEIIPKLKILL